MFANQPGDASSMVVTNLAQANISIKVPVLVYQQLMIASQRLSCYGTSSVIQLFLRQYLLHWAKVWKQSGYTEFKRQIKEQWNSLFDVLDYLDGEGFEQGFPDRQSTWVSLQRRSENWHDRAARIHFEQFLKNQSEKKLCEWESLLPETVVDDVCFTPITNNRSLALHGFDMKHCVGGYDWRCHRGNYLVFAAKDRGGSLSTLGLNIQGSQVKVDQHRGRLNTTVPEKTQKAGRSLAVMYQQALKQRTSLPRRA